MFLSLSIVCTVIISVLRTSGENFGTYLASALVVIFVKTLFALYFILTNSNLKEYFSSYMNTFFNLRLIKPIVTFFKYFFGCWIDAFLLLICVGPKYPKNKVTDGTV